MVERLIRKKKRVVVHGARLSRASISTRPEQQITC